MNNGASGAMQASRGERQGDAGWEAIPIHGAALIG
jgi:hypothetical protein